MNSSCAPRPVGDFRAQPPGRVVEVQRLGDRRAVVAVGGRVPGRHGQRIDPLKDIGRHGPAHIGLPIETGSCFEASLNALMVVLLTVGSSGDPVLGADMDRLPVRM